MRAALMVLLQQNCLLVRTAVPEGGPGAILAAQTLYQVDVLSILDQIRYASTPDILQLVHFVGSRVSMIRVHVSSYCSVLGRQTETADVWNQLQHLHPCYAQPCSPEPLWVDCAPLHPSRGSLAATCHMHLTHLYLCLLLSLHLHQQSARNLQLGYVFEVALTVQASCVAAACARALPGGPGGPDHRGFARQWPLDPSTGSTLPGANVPHPAAVIVSAPSFV